MAWVPSFPVPPSETRDGEPYKLRFLGQVDPDRPVQRGYGSLAVMAVIGSIVILVIGGAVYLGLMAQGEVHVTLSNLVTQVGSCQTRDQVAGGTQTVTYDFILTDTGTHGAVVTVDLYGNGELIYGLLVVTVPAGQAVPVHAAATTYTCGPVTPTVAIRSVSPVG